METVPDRRTWVDKVLARLGSHVEAEQNVLADYAAVAETVDAPDVRYLMRLILDDERRHHRIFQEMTRAVQAGLEGRHLEPEVPALTGRPLPEAVRALTRRLLAVEREDERELKSLRRQLRPVADTTLWALLVDLMALDTKKHERILGFIIDHTDG
jgi:rubrerythrin